MDDATRKEWLHAAYIALEGIPLDLLQRGAKDALKSADHPSKIVPAIVKSVGETWENRKALVARRAQTAAEIAQQVADNRALRLAGPEPVGPETTKEILARAWPTMAQHEPGYQAGKLNLDPDRECRQPTRADYLALGVAPEALDAMGIA